MNFSGIVCVKRHTRTHNHGPLTPIFRQNSGNDKSINVMSVHFILYQVDESFVWLIVIRVACIIIMLTCSFPNDKVGPAATLLIHPTPTHPITYSLFYSDHFSD